GWTPGRGQQEIGEQHPAPEPGIVNDPLGGVANRFTGTRPEQFAHEEVVAMALLRVHSGCSYLARISRSARHDATTAFSGNSLHSTTSPMRSARRCRVSRCA